MDEQTTMDAAEKVLDEVVPDVVETVNVVKNNPVLLVGVAVISLAAGGVVGYHIAKRRLEKRFAELAQEEIAEAKNFYRVLHKREELETPESAVEALVPEEDRMVKEAAGALRSYKGEDVKVVDDKTGLGVEVKQVKDAKLHSVSLDKEVGSAGGHIEQVIEVETVEGVSEKVSNIFVENQPFDTSQFDYDAEREARDQGLPYIISREEFFENDLEHEQVTVTYYQGDDVLVDEHDKPIDDVYKTVGDDNLVKFGYGSGDNNVVYVRNGERELDFEILRHEGKYAEHVLGYIEHSDHKPRIRRFRGGED